LTLAHGVVTTVIGNTLSYNTLVAYNASTGAVLWSNTSTGNFTHQEFQIGTENVLLDIMSNQADLAKERYIIARNIMTGNEIWNYGPLDISNLAPWDAAPVLAPSSSGEYIYVDINNRVIGLK